MSLVPDADLDALLAGAPPAPAAPQPAANPFRTVADAAKLWGANQGANVELLSASPRRIAADMLRLFIANRTPLTLWGPVGARKTKTIQALARELDGNGVPFQVVILQLSTVDPTILMGIQYTSREGDRTIMRRSVPNVARLVVDYHAQTGGHTIFFLDEITTANNASQAASLGLLTDFRFEDTDLSEYITIVLAGNPEGTVSTVNEVSEAFINRGGHIAWYGDVSLFLEEWGSGFGGAVAAPPREIRWFITELLHAKPEEAFRNSANWKAEELIPWERLEHSERVVTELARMTALINEVLADAPTAVRHFYIVEATRALLGRTWADRAATVLAAEAALLDPQAVLAKIAAAGGIDPRMEFDVLDGTVLRDSGVDLHARPDGAPLTTSEEAQLMEALVERVTRDGFARDAYLAAWAFAVTAPTAGGTMLHHAAMVRLAALASDAVRAEALPAVNAIPVFVTAEVRQRLRAAVAG